MSSKKTDYLKMHDWTEADPWRLAEVSENFKKMDKKAKDLDTSMAATVSTAADAKTTANGIDAKATDALTKSTEAVQNVSTAVQKANSAESKATEAKTVSDNALAKAGAAESIANGVQTQFNQVVITGDSSVEAAQARVNTSGQTYSTLKQRLDSEHQEVTVKLAEEAQKVEALSLDKASKSEVQGLVTNKADITYVDSKLGQIGDAKPSGVYLTLSALQSAFPTGNGKNIYLVTADGKWYYWNGSAWTAGGTYQSTGIADKSVVQTKLDDTLNDKIHANSYITDLLNNASRITQYNAYGGVITGSSIFIPAGSSGLSTVFKAVNKVEPDMIGMTLRFHYDLTVETTLPILADNNMFSAVIATMNNGVVSDTQENIGFSNRTIIVNGNKVKIYYDYTIKAGDQEIHPAIQIRNATPLTANYRVTANAIGYEVLKTNIPNKTNTMRVLDRMDKRIENHQISVDLKKFSAEVRSFATAGVTISDNQIKIVAGKTGYSSVLKYVKDITKDFVGSTVRFKFKIAASTAEFNNLNIKSFETALAVTNNGVTNDQMTTNPGTFNIKQEHVGGNVFKTQFDYIIKSGDTSLQPVLQIKRDSNLTSDISLTVESLSMELVSSDNEKTPSSILFNEVVSMTYKSREPATVTVAAYNSSAQDKAMADLVCDGANDEVELRKAIDFFKTRSGKIKLCNGDYHIDALYNTGNATYGKFALPILNPVNTREIIFEGANAPLRDKSANTLDLTISPVIRLSESVYNSLTDTELATIIGVVPNLSNGDISYPGISLIVKNIGIVIPNNKKSIILVDAKYASTFKIDSVVGCPKISNYSGPYDDSKLPVIGCIGVRGLQGLNYGEGYRMDNCFMYGMGIGYSICGEHLIANNLGSYNCLYNYGFGLYDEGRISAHPNTLINCCGEQSVNDCLFGRSEGKQSITFIDYNMEVMPNLHGWTMNPSTEQYPGEFCGIITYSSTGEFYTNYENIPFWAEGHGKSFKTINTRSRLMGTTAQRSTRPNLYQEYIDTDLNKKLTYYNGAWRDANGAAV